MHAMSPYCVIQQAVTVNRFAELTADDSFWGPIDSNWARRQVEVARYHNPVWRELLNTYLSLREQLKQAKQLQSACPPAGKSWSAWGRYVNAMRNHRASAVRRLTIKVNAARKALGQPIAIWKKRR
jgi:hypothetical protein